MSTDLRPTAPNNPAPAAPDKKKIDLSFSQVIGGALAAMTAAFLGSRLSLAGTVTGAAMASIVAAVASNLYTASLRTTREKVRTALRGRTDGSAPVAEESATGWDWDHAAEPAAAHLRPQASGARSGPTGGGSTTLQRVRWRSVVIAALAAFALAAAVLTGLELASGQSLSGGKGTTITQVAEHGPAAAPTTHPAGGASASPSPTSSPTAAEPSASASSEPSVQPSASEPAPTVTPSATAEPSASDSATPDPGTGLQPGTDEGTG